MDIGGGVGVGDCVGVTVNVGVCVGVIGVAERTLVSVGDSVAELANTLGVIFDGLLSPLPTFQHPQRKNIKANTNRYARRIRDRSCFNKS
jgi:hypothetical protein